MYGVDEGIVKFVSNMPTADVLARDTTADASFEPNSSQVATSVAPFQDT